LFVGPWWFFALSLTASFFVIDYFFEGIMWGFGADILYSSIWGYHGFDHVFLGISIIVFLISIFLRGKLSWQS